jgi:hypothetical protein
MHYKAKNVAALKTLLGGWPDRTRVECDPGLGVSAKTVGDLRKVTRLAREPCCQHAARPRSRPRDQGAPGKPRHAHRAEGLKVNAPVAGAVCPNTNG